MCRSPLRALGPTNQQEQHLCHGRLCRGSSSSSSRSRSPDSGVAVRTDNKCASRAEGRKKTKKQKKNSPKSYERGRQEIGGEQGLNVGAAECWHSAPLPRACRRLILYPAEHCCSVLAKNVSFIDARAHSCSSSRDGGPRNRDRDSMRPSALWTHWG